MRMNELSKVLSSAKKIKFADINRHYLGTHMF